MKLALGFPLDAAEAHRIGVSQWLVPQAELMERAHAVAAHIAALPPLAARLVKESVLQGTQASVADAAMADIYRFRVLEQTDDAREAHAAWCEKRPARVRGI